MNKQYEQVKEFHTAFGIAMPEKPTMLSRGGDVFHFTALEVTADHLAKSMKTMKNFNRGGEVNKRASWILEELVEFIRAETIEDQADALTDLIYFALGTFTLIGVKPEALFDIVQAANMAKLGPDGKPVYDKQGKIVKPEGWESPEPKIAAEIIRQYER